MVKRMSENKEFKETDIGCVPREWDLCNFGENSKIKARIGWQGLTTKEYKNSGDYFLITGTDFENNNIKWETCHYVDKFRYDQDVNIQIKDNDILITKDGTIGKVAFVDKMTKPATLNSGVFVIRPINSCYEPKFLFYVLKSFYFDKFLKQLTAGSTINHLYQKDIVKFNFVSPSIDEQKAIATALSDMDDLILSLEKLISKKKLIKEGAMQELLYGKKRLDGFSGNWSLKSVGELCEVKGGKRLPKGYTLEDNKNNHPYIRVSDMYMGGISEVGIKYVPIEIAKIIDNYKISKDDLFISVAGTLGIIGRIPESLDGANLTENANKLCNIKCNKVFLMYALQSDRIQKTISGISTIGAQPKLALTKIKDFKICLPDMIEEQEAIAKILSDMDNEIEILGKKLDKYKNIKDGMMEELLTGKRRLV